jgi:hypothetical protein
LGRKIVIGLAFLAGLGACTPDPGFTGVPQVREARADEVAGCTYVSDISMKPGVYGPLEERGAAYARNRIKADARDQGADNVVFREPKTGEDPYTIRATAYRCRA